ncbi:hypothetical protein [Roseobacter weihaiensis]|uniref:hypothetical protein n=1 Tax=Roseobacter weihaiensis TaxID=2763262 RepID=UPI001D09EE43|nr:hypothetical protein [Roseobacter sp. H9]
MSLAVSADPSKIPIPNSGLLLKDGGALLGQLQRAMLLDQIEEISHTSPILFDQQGADLTDRRCSARHGA